MAQNAAIDPRTIEEHFEEFLRNVRHASGPLTAQIEIEMRRVFFHGATATAILFADAVVQPEGESIELIAAVVAELHHFAAEDPDADASAIAIDGPGLHRTAAKIRKREAKPARRQFSHALTLHKGGRKGGPA